MAEKKNAKSSYEDYMDALNKITPQIKQLLQIAAGGDGAQAGAAPKRRRARRTVPLNNYMQAVNNEGKILVGTTDSDGKFHAKGEIGQVCEDLLGVEDVNTAGRRVTRRKRRAVSPSRRTRTPSPRSPRGRPSVMDDY
ncbi:ORF172 [Saltwater crocodilepox virus]|nr:virion core protein [Saltwater crocodilepox virus]QGT46609.1 ORF172 [Saltwater crocodilepox virus]QGT46826.1 ORF172 [Saltwater crocodilepox virus]QGT47041.1 ORF172 [Saltwater crocodilepox virus]QGT47254.1 ORF172 [Saltwater crocodilepox virus]